MTNVPFIANVAFYAVYSTICVYVVISYVCFRRFCVMFLTWYVKFRFMFLKILIIFLIMGLWYSNVIHVRLVSLLFV